MTEYKNIMKTKFGEAILTTLKIAVATIPAWLGTMIFNNFFPNKPALMILLGLFNLWFVGWTANKLWGWK